MWFKIYTSLNVASSTTVAVYVLALLWAQWFEKNSQSPVAYSSIAMRVATGSMGLLGISWVVYFIVMVTKGLKLIPYAPYGLYLMVVFIILLLIYYTYGVFMEQISRQE